MMVEVAYATATQQKIIQIEVLEGCTIAEAIKVSQIEKYFPDLSLAAVGIDGVKKTLTDTVHAHERIEIYRPLLRNPKDTRRLKAQRLK